MKCKVCKKTALVALPSRNAGFCADCFLSFFSRQVEKAIRSHSLFTRDDRILVALSGGKDSLALMEELGRLGYNVTGLHIDLAIPGSSRKAREIVEDFCRTRGLPLIVRRVEEEGLSIPLVKKHLRRPVCSVCGKIKRYFFNRTARENGFTVLATGHNLDDEIGRLFSNLLRWDEAYLAGQAPALPADEGFARKVRPLFRLSEFETANYAFLRGIRYHQEPCPYSAGATFSAYKRLWADLEEKMPGRKLDFYLGFLERGRRHFQEPLADAPLPVSPCAVCASPTSAGVCGVCRARALIRERALAGALALPGGEK